MLGQTLKPAFDREALFRVLRAVSHRLKPRRILEKMVFAEVHRGSNLQCNASGVLYVPLFTVEHDVTKFI